MARKKKLKLQNRARVQSPASRDFCRISRQFIPKSESRLSHLGALLHLRRSLGFGAGWYFGTAIAFYFASLILGVLSLWRHELFLHWFELVCLVGLLAFALPMLLRSSWIQSSSHWTNLFHSSDFWLAAFGLVFLFESHPAIPSWKPLFIFSLWIFWIGLEYFESASWLKTLKSSFEKPAPLWHDKIKLAPMSWILMLTVVIAFALATLFGNTPAWSALALAFTLCSFPLSTWIVTKVLQTAEAHGWKVFQWDQFRKLRFVRVIWSHFQGVFTQPALKLESLWIEPHHEWPESSVKEILYRLTETSDHPVCRALRADLKKPHRQLIELTQFVTIPHLGLEGRIRDVQHKEFVFRFGSLPWHRILQHSMSDEGRSQLKNQIDENYVISLLSIDDVIVASAAFRAIPKSSAPSALAQLADQFKVVLASSASMRWTPQPLPTSLAFDLFPIEREIMAAQITDRRHQFQQGKQPFVVEWAAPWDSPTFSDATPRILYSPNLSPHPGGHYAIQVYSDELSSFQSAFTASKSFHKQWIFGHLLLILGALIILLGLVPSYGALLLLLCYGLSICWIRRSQVQ